MFVRYRYKTTKISKYTTLKVGFLKTEVINLLFSLQILTSKNETLFFQLGK